MEGLEDEEIYIIDFADALIAPIELELADIIWDGFKFDGDYGKGFMGVYNKKIELAEKLLYGLLIHDYGANIICDNIGMPDKIQSLDDLESCILAKI